MSFGFSIGDVKLIWSTVTWFHEKCFTKAQGAAVQYLQFGREIESFASRLRKLIEVAEHAAQKRPVRAWGNHDDECRQALKPLVEAVGDFQATIQECQKLLDDNNRFRKDASGFIDNVQWHLGTQRDVDILRERVQFHSTKLHVLTKPFELQLLLEILYELRELRREVQEIRGLLITVLANGKLAEPGNSRVVFPAIPPEIEQRFQEASSREDTDSTYDGANMPLAKGFDALVYQFARSTVDFNPVYGNVPEETQFVNLLKSKWIMERLENSLYLQLEGPTSFWASYLHEVKADIIREYRRFDSKQLEAPPKETIIRLPDQCFTIWAKKAPPLRPPDLAEKRYEEEFVLELSLPESAGAYTTVMTVFKRSAIDFRFVTSTKHSTNPGDYQKELPINTNVMRIIPAYAAPKAGPTAHNILLSSLQTKDRMWQYLSSFEDVKALQHVLTGYRVHHSMVDVSWSINGSSKPGEIGKGILQLWQRQVLPIPSEDEASSNRQASNSLGSPTATNNSQRPSTTLSTATTFVSGSSAISRVNGSRDDATAVLLPDFPVLIMLTVRDKKYSFIHVELSPDTFVDPDRCDCRRYPKVECQVAVLKSTNKYIQLRRHCTQGESDSDLDAWDLARFRMPRHPQFEKTEVVPKAKYLRLKFPHTTEKDDFRRELKALERIRKMDVDTYDSILSERRQRDRRPGRRRS